MAVFSGTELNKFPSSPAGLYAKVPRTPGISFKTVFQSAKNGLNPGTSEVTEIDEEKESPSVGVPTI